MSIDNGASQYSVFIGFKKDAKTGGISGFMLSPDRKHAENYAAGKESDAEADVPETIEDNVRGEEDLSPVATLCSGMIEKFNQGLSPYHQLIAITGMMRGGMERAAIENGIYGECKSRGELLTDENGFEVYGLSFEAHELVAKGIGRMRETDAGFALLPSSIILSLVATFDSLIGDALKALLSLQPERLQNSEKTITYRDLFQIGDLQKAREQFIETEVEKLLRGSHEEQVSYIEKLIDTKIIGHYSRWPNFVELFERRNRIAHASGVVNADYVDKCKTLGYPTDNIELGKELKLSPRYLHKVVDVLVEFGVTMAFVTWRKLAPDSEGQAFETLNEVAYDLIKQRRYQLATWLLDFCLAQTEPWCERCYHKAYVREFS